MIQGNAFEAVDVAALDTAGEYIHSALEVSPAAGGWFDRLHLVVRARRALEILELQSPRQREIYRTLNHALPDFYVWARNMRTAGRPVDVAPPMDSALAEFETNMSRIVDVLQARGTVPVLVTQPALWRDDLTPAERDALWLGSADGWPPRTEGGPYYSVRVMADLLDRYNQVLRQIAARRGIELIDLAKLMHADLGTCYDDVHFNEAGSKKVAEILGERLLAGKAISRK